MTKADNPDAIGVEHVWVCAADGVCGSLNVGVEINDDNDDDNDVCATLGAMN